jgi:hypothetical protein
VPVGSQPRLLEGVLHRPRATGPDSRTGGGTSYDMVGKEVRGGDGRNNFVVYRVEIYHTLEYRVPMPTPGRYALSGLEGPLLGPAGATLGPGAPSPRQARRPSRPKPRARRPGNGGRGLRGQKPEGDGRVTPAKFSGCRPKLRGKGPPIQGLADQAGWRPERCATARSRPGGPPETPDGDGEVGPAGSGCTPGSGGEVPGGRCPERPEVSGYRP